MCAKEGYENQLAAVGGRREGLREVSPATQLHDLYTTSQEKVRRSKHVTGNVFVMHSTHPSPFLSFIDAIFYQDSKCFCSMAMLLCAPPPLSLNSLRKTRGKCQCV